MAQTSDLFVRVARLDDEDALGRIDRDSWSTLHAVKPPQEPPYGPFFHETCLPEDFLVAELDGRVSGYIRLGFATPLASNAHVRQIQGLLVAEEARGRGVARALLSAVMDAARRQGARRITLRVLGHNAPARKLYESMGFAVEGIQPGEFYLAGEYVDDVMMGRSL
ncbi:GNAT family N-acetyltransferase [Streptomyces odontomachi]|uniref:GNAT family N-acetyltransferase n=1 Tax=Streptomyces odontomachi TaxID=2944940 RepID=UPI00210C8788|nr:GNAT family N-acetyltransferase [Streptomyces sp. ODS25]